MIASRNVTMLTTSAAFVVGLFLGTLATSLYFHPSRSLDGSKTGDIKNTGLLLFLPMWTTTKPFALWFTLFKKTRGV
jgi:hypothetical protein